LKRSIIAVTLFLLVPITLLLAQGTKRVYSTARASARGEYLVENVGLCGDCHSPHNEKGEVPEGQELRGAALEFKPAVPMPVWADKAPNIAGLPGWEKDAAIKFLMTGIAYNGLPARPPMPRYRFNQQDAAAIVAYLQSLKSAN
jgi:mono/diheme cytochrome c family protein